MTGRCLTRKKVVCFKVKIFVVLKRGRKEFEMEGVEIDEKINSLTKQLEEAQKIAEEADKRYDEVS